LRKPNYRGSLCNTFRGERYLPMICAPTQSWRNTSQRDSARNYECNTRSTTLGCRTQCKKKGKAWRNSQIRCRRLCQKTIRKVNDGMTQRVISEEAEQRLVAAYINGLGGIVGQQVRFRMPSSLDEAVQVVITVSNAKGTKLTDTRRVFSAKWDSREMRLPTTDDLSTWVNTDGADTTSRNPVEDHARVLAEGLRSSIRGGQGA